MEVDYIEMAILELEKRNGISASFARTMYNGMKSRIEQLEAAQHHMHLTGGESAANQVLPTPEVSSAPKQNLVSPTRK